MKRSEFEKNTSSRIQWIDNLKFFLMIFVIFGHVKNLCDSSVTGMKIASEFWVSWDIPAFVFLSGYFSYKSISRIEVKEDLFRYIKRISLRMLLPLVVSIVILRLITFGKIGSFSSMWFIDFLFYSLFTYSCLSFVFRQKHFVSCLVYLLLSLGINKYYMMDMMWYFVFGLLFKRYDILNQFVLKKSIGTNIMVGFVFTMSIVLFIFYTHDYKFYFNPLEDLLVSGLGYIYILRILVALGFIISLIYIFERYDKQQVAGHSGGGQIYVLWK